MGGLRRSPEWTTSRHGFYRTGEAGNPHIKHRQPVPWRIKSGNESIILFFSTANTRSTILETKVS